MGCFFEFPEVEGLKRKLSRKLSLNEDKTDWEVVTSELLFWLLILSFHVEWALYIFNYQVDECLGMWWRPDFETLLCPYMPPNVKSPKVRELNLLSCLCCCMSS